MGSRVNSAIRIGHAAVTLDDVASIASGGARLGIAEEASERIDASRDMVVRAVEVGETIYGVTTGFGALSNQTITSDSATRLQINLLRSHAAGTGHAFPDEVVRLMLVLRAHALALGYSGVRRDVIQRLLDLYRLDVLPVVPSQGSVGASGDLAPLAHLALPIAGEGRVKTDGAISHAGPVLARLGMRPLALEPKEALALINGTQAMTAVGALAAVQASRTLDAAIAAGALTIIALNGRTASFDDRIQRVRPHQGQIEVAQQLRGLLDGWVPDDRLSRPVQDRYSLRAMPQVFGAVLDTLRFTEQALVTEINSATDNPLFFPEDDEIINGANFHGHPVALACDHLKTAVASLSTFSERRIASLVDPRASGLPGFLVAEPGINSGLMIPHYVAASLVSENRLLAHPASVDSLSTSADVEDYNSMGLHAARMLALVVENAARVVAIELICAAQAINLRGVGTKACPVGAVYELVRNHVPFLSEDRFGVGEWVDELALQIRHGQLSLPITVTERTDGRESSDE